MKKASKFGTLALAVIPIIAFRLFLQKEFNSGISSVAVK
jgi:ABC-type glycerol-3-phosphate transport system permease component